MKSTTTESFGDQDMQFVKLKAMYFHYFVTANLELLCSKQTTS